MEKNRDVPGDVVKSDEVIGRKVKNPQDENLGKIEEIVLDKKNGLVRYVVLSHDGFLGMGDKFTALPWSIFKYDPNEECFILNVDKEKIKNAPSFDKDNWPNMSDRTWGEKVYSYYGERFQ